MKKKAYNYDDFHFREVSKMIVSLNSESDRAVALIVSQWLDDALEEMFKRSLVQDKAAIKQVFQFTSALGAFSSRITLAYLTGLISKKIRDNLDIIREIRNDFAHTRDAILFTEEKVRDKCKNLHLKCFKGQKESFRNAFIATGIGILGAFIELVSCGCVSKDGQDGALKMVEEMEKGGIEMVKNFTGETLS